MIEIFFIIIFIIVFVTILTGQKKKELLNQTFYDYKKVYPFLSELKKNKVPIKNEVLHVSKELWKTWPETYLYKNKDGWKIFPFYGFYHWVPENCEKCPVIYNILKKIPGLRTATLSRLGSNTQLKPHYGYNSLSNYILRCHYGILVDKGCIIGCENDIREMKENDIIVFDDSKLHYAENNGNHDRIVLILDIDRPNFIKKGTSIVEKTDELTELLNFFKN